MRMTARFIGRMKAQGGSVPAPVTSTGTSISAPVGGWDAFSPISNMPPENAVELINWFPQPGWVELRRGFVNHVDTGTGSAVESIIAYQGATPTSNRLFAASGGKIYDVTGSPASVAVSGLSNNRWQRVNYAGSGGNFLWICNGQDTPRYYNGTSWNTATITGVTPEDMVACVIHRSRIWAVLKDSTKAAYLPLDSVQGAATVFDLGTYFQKGGYLQAIGTWSTDVNGGTNEFICFVSSYGEVAIFLIYDPTSATGFSYRGIANIGSPIGRRCLEKVGSDLVIITIDGVVPLSQVVNYDRAALLRASLTKNIRAAMTDAARDYKDQFGWQIISYPRSTMAILNVPTVENVIQQQYVMNTITGAWCRFVGQNANCWEIYDDRAYFGGNDGVVHLADEASGDEGQDLVADIQGAFNYFGQRGQTKRWTTLRPLLTKDTSFLVDVEVGLSIDFQLNDALDDLLTDGSTQVAIWNDPNTIWDDPSTIWPGQVTNADWLAVSGIGYNAAIRMMVTIPWSDARRVSQVLRVNGFDILYDSGGFI